MNRYRFLYILALILTFLLPPSLPAADLTGRVVGISDGDTITVLQDRRQYKIRLAGIDTPESHQDFGTKAKQFTSDRVFKKQVRVEEKDVDRYGRIVGMVYYDDRCLNEDLVRAGYAWVYRQYCKYPVCSQWLGYEDEARQKGIGLWAGPEPTPPWEFRRGRSKSSAPTSKASVSGGLVHGNVKSHVFHNPSCTAFNCKNCTAVFGSREEAIAAGYRACGR
ncbi:thermonuclease family protein [Desulfococcus multivorans]|uniref:Nuclease (SNase domain-containing protein) n=1 Tax=Desulfococcus multivorans DSM 2059 TaxID=1121405 RepID=S7ULQ6_DESML|nr:thermonuclease family protein [Desulfococcus multivorans]AOY57311.1 nuclease, related to SNase [Desulfococcus multivorans]AQU99762.1 nuclease [Desulfococcus multivorans]EPR33263.1 nuclease (SNase domain-containing protein) [Desulfococcus multivorans DSM 2059]SKA21822.1 Endonuclease YncB, thermonuclease family [Desulfococcus multivorans DSM 2059]